MFEGIVVNVRIWYFRR